MTNQHFPITPPPELRRAWLDNDDFLLVGGINALLSITQDRLNSVIAQAAQWGWDQRGVANEAELQKARDEELEAMLAELKALNLPDGYVNMLRAARRPKPPSKADQALEALEEINQPLGVVTVSRVSIIRHALERLKELEGQVKCQNALS